MERDITFNIRVTWSNLIVSDNEQPLVGVKIKLFHIRYGVSRCLFTGYLDEDGCVTIYTQEKNYRTFDDKTSFEVVLLSVSENKNYVYSSSRTEKTELIFRESCDPSTDEYDFYYRLTPEYDKNAFYHMSEEEIEDERQLEEEPEEDILNNNIIRIVQTSFLEMLSRFAREELEIEPKRVAIKYPIYGAHVSHAGRGTTYIKKRDGLNFNTLAHEYGHIIQRWIWKGKHKGNGAHHNYDVDMTADNKKYVGLRDAFLEATTEFFAARITKIFSDKYGEPFKSLSCEANYVNSKVHGEGNEGSIFHFLWDLSDDEGDRENLHRYIDDDTQLPLNTYDEVDCMSLSDKEIFDVLCEIKHVHFYSFLDKLYEMHPYDKERIRFLLALHGFTPYYVRIESIDEKKDEITIKWEPGGCYESGYYDDDAKLSKDVKKCKTYQNRFEVTIYDQDEDIIEESGEIKKPKYKFDFSLVKKIRDKYGMDYFLARIKGISTIRMDTEFESPLYCVYFKSYMKDGSLIVCPVDFAEVRNNTEAEIKLAGQKFVFKSWLASITNRATIQMRKDSNFSFEFKDKHYNTMQLVFPKGNNYTGPLKIVCEYEHGKTREFDYLKQYERVTDIKALAGNIGDKPTKVTVENEGDALIIKKIIFSNN